MRPEGEVTTQVFRRESGHDLVSDCMEGMRVREAERMMWGRAWGRKQWGPAGVRGLRDEGDEDHDPERG